MIDYARTVDPLEEALVRLDAMLAGLADEHGEYRSTEELLGGIIAVRDKVHEVCQLVTVRARGWKEPFRTAHSTLSRGSWGFGPSPRVERESVAVAL
jgi:hypothetical protein